MGKDLGANGGREEWSEGYECECIPRCVGSCGMRLGDSEIWLQLDSELYLVFAYRFLEYRLLEHPKKRH